MPGPVTSAYWRRLLGAPHGCIGPSDQGPCACRTVGATGARGLRSALLRQAHRPPLLAPAPLVLLGAAAPPRAVRADRPPAAAPAAGGEAVHPAPSPPA